MSKGALGRAKKAEYFVKLQGLLQEYNSIFVVHCDNVGSNQLQQIRISMRGEGVILFGKNTMIRKCVKDMSEEHPHFEKLLPVIRGNVGFVFTNSDLKAVRAKVLANRVRAPAKAGAVAQVDVFVPGGSTGMEPGKTSFFQALGIPTKITKGVIEIVNEVHLIKKDAKVGASEAALLNMLNISPFTYGLSIDSIYDNGAVFGAEILDIEESDLIKELMSGIQRIAALSLAINYPTVASVPHSLVNGYKDLIAISLATNYGFPAADKIKEILSDPSKMAAMQAAAAPVASASPVKAAVAAKVEEKEESDEEMGFGLFD